MYLCIPRCSYILIAADARDSVELIRGHFRWFYAVAQSFIVHELLRLSRSQSRVSWKQHVDPHRGINQSRSSLVPAEVQSSASAANSVDQTSRSKKQHRIAEGSLRELTSAKMAAREKPRGEKRANLHRVLFYVKTRVKDVKIRGAVREREATRVETREEESSGNKEG